ncbi:TOBE domain-containing protein [Arenibacter sp. 6A1]|uniref:TOBE domain-containing protein n=1 Tax=Arenibacter sp. 6A1 TaxID=2720391 RepID=UPI0014484DA9|nr:TOBE domain-containing protein [Arenibacter sp. 6A1]NKI25666.1 TOBE domain-containing protein [Arenibacter sp. 6A1]
MNSFQGAITHIQTSGNLTMVIVTIKGNVSIKAVLIDTPKTAAYLVLGREVTLMFKETEVVLATKVGALSIDNELNGRITAMENGALLSRICLSTSAGEVVAVISTDAARKLALTVGKEATAMIKLNEVILAP